MLRIVSRFVHRSFSSTQYKLRGPEVTKSEPAVHKDVVESLEHLSLVDFSTAEAIKCLEDAVQFADRLFEVNTDNVEGIIGPIHDRNENLRADEVTESSKREDLMRLVTKSEELYYIAPPGNISIRKSSKENQ